MLAATPPTFRPVGQYEVGRGYAYGGGTGDANFVSGNQPPRRGGLFRGLFGGGR